MIAFPNGESIVRLYGHSLRNDTKLRTGSLKEVRHEHGSLIVRKYIWKAYVRGYPALYELFPNGLCCFIREKGGCRVVGASVHNVERRFPIDSHDVRYYFMVECYIFRH